MRTAVLRLSFIGMMLSIVGCDRNPNVDIIGSYFPGWMISLVLGVGLTFGAHSLLSKQGLDHALGHPSIIYPSMVLMFTCLLWLGFFA